MKHILLIFLSDIKTNTKGEKVFISESFYETANGAKIHVTNESAVRYIRDKGITLDKIFIFASEKVRGDIIDNRSSKKYLGEDGKPRTHLEYFKERLSSEFQLNVDKCIDVYPYDEKKSSSAYNLKSVAEMAGRIQDFAQDCGEEVTLHVDLTGGMRHINMMMLDVTRLLEYSGIENDRLIYTNYDFDTKICRVEEVKDIYDLFQLISGVEEFAQFGSVKALKDYYSDKNKSPAIKNLVDAMENFADEIKLCHYGQLKDAIVKLHDAVRDFKADPDNVQDTLMDRLIKRISRDYHSLIELRDLDDLRVIRWCIENDYMQQALTLYTERVPEYLGENGFITQTQDKAKKLDEEVRLDKMHRERWFYLLNEVQPEGDYSVDSGVSKFCKTLKEDAIKAAKSKNFNYEDWWSKLSVELESMNIYCTDEPRLRQQIELIAELWKDPKPLLELSSSELEPIRTIIDKLSPKLEPLPTGFERRKCITEFIYNIEVAEVKNYFPEFVFAVDIETVRDILAKYPNALKFYRMIQEGIFSVTAPLKTEDFFSIMDKYVRLKIERNNTNHAHVELGEFPTAESLKKFIAVGLNEIEEAKKLCTKSL